MASGVTDKTITARPSGTSATSLYSPTSPVNNVKVYNLIITNTTGVAATYTVHFDNDGSTYDANSLIIPTTSLAANTMISIPLVLAFDSVSGNLAVTQGTSQALTFHLTISESLL